MFPLISPDDTNIKRGTTPTASQITPPVKTTPIRLDDQWQRLVDDTWTISLLITNIGNEYVCVRVCSFYSFFPCHFRVVSDLSLWLQSHGASPLHSRSVLIARGFLNDDNPCSSTSSHPVPSSSLAPNESACFVLSTKALTDSLLSSLILCSWSMSSSHPSRGYTQLSQASFSIGGCGDESTPLVDYSILSHLSNTSE